VYDTEGQPDYYGMGSLILVPEKRIVSLRFLEPPAQVERRGFLERLRRKPLRPSKGTGPGQ